jgi:hypothetical protein
VNPALELDAVRRDAAAGTMLVSPNADVAPSNGYTVGRYAEPGQECPPGYRRALLAQTGDNLFILPQALPPEHRDLPSFARPSISADAVFPVTSGDRVFLRLDDPPRDAGGLLYLDFTPLLADTTGNQVADGNRVPVPETRDHPTNCRQLAPVRRGDSNPAAPEYTEFVELNGRGVKIKPFTAGEVPAVSILMGTDPLLIDTVARQLGINQADVYTIVSLLSNGAMLCPAMARETIRALQQFLEQNPRCPDDATPQEGTRRQ